MKNLLSKAILLTALSILLFGCKKDVTDPTEGKYTAPEIVKSENFVYLPAEAQQYPESGVATSVIGTFNGLFNSYKSYLEEIPEDAVYSSLKSTSDVWEWQAGGIAVKIVGTDHGTYSQVKLHINNVVVADIIEYIGVVKGSNKLYQMNGTLAIDHESELIGTDTNSKYLLVGESDTYFVHSLQSTLNSSGYLDMFKGSSEAGEQIYHCQWTASGSCSGWLRDPETGKTFSFPTE